MASYGGFDVTVQDNTKEVFQALNTALQRGLAACGETAVGYAQDKCPVDTGHLRNSISYKVVGNDCYIGTNVNYAPYIEYGTGVGAEKGGRKTPWIYTDKNGNTHLTHGYKAHPFLRPAAKDHTKEYQGIIKDSLENA